MTQTERHKFEWTHGFLTIEIQVTLRKQYFGSVHDHLEIRSLNPKQHPLPVTNTGYKSLWPIHGEYPSAKNAAEAIRGWLDESTESDEWKIIVADSEQPSLF